MPKKGKDRRSGRDDARDLAGGLGGDEDYDWIRYLGEGRPSGSAGSGGSAVSSVSSASAVSSSAVSSVSSVSVPPAAPPALRPVAAGPSTLPGRPHRDPDPERDRLADRPAVLPERPAARTGLPAVRPERAAGRPERPAGRPERPAARPDRAERARLGERKGRTERTGRPVPPAAYGTDRAAPTADDRPPGPLPPARPAPRPAVRLTAGRAVDLVSGGDLDLAFNPAAGDYREPLYAEPSSPPRRTAGPEPDWPEPGLPEAGLPEAGWPEAGWPEPESPGHELAERDWSERGRQERGRPDARLDTAEYASPLYPSGGPDLAALNGPAGLAGPAGFAGPSAPARSSGRARPPAPVGPHWSEPADDPLADTDVGRRPAARDRGSAGRAVRPGQTGPLPRLDARAGDMFGGGSGAARGTGVAEPGGADLSFGPVADDDPPEIALLDRQQRYRGKPVRKPGKAAKAGRPAKGKARGPQARGRAGSGKSRSGTGRRRSRKVLAIGSVVVVVALAVAGYLALRPGPAHSISAPAALGSFTRQRADATAEQLKLRLMTAARGDVKNVVAAVYQRKSGAGTQIVLFIGGNLAGSASASSLISAYMTRLHGAFTTSAGALGGQAACAPGSGNGPAECAWADSDTFGVVVSAGLSSAALADEMRLMRPQIEHVVR